MAAALPIEVYDRRQVGVLYEIPNGFISWGWRTEWQESSIMEGAYLRCLAGEVYTPTRFYLNLVENWSRLEMFMEYLQKCVKEQILDCCSVNMHSTARLEFMTPGLYCLCMYQEEWHRALVIFRDPDNVDIITVELIDYGTEVEVTIDKLRYMLIYMMTELPPQGIKCRLRFDPPYDYYLEKTAMVWPQEARDKLFEAVQDKFLGVTFLERLNEPLLQDRTIHRGTWIVSVAVMAHEYEGPFKPLNLTRVTREDKKRLKKEAEGKVDPVDAELCQKLKKLKAIDPSLPKHADGAFATVPQKGFADLSIRFYKYVQRCRLPWYYPPHEEMAALIEVDEEDSDSNTVDGEPEVDDDASDSHTVDGEPEGDFSSVTCEAPSELGTDSDCESIATLAAESETDCESLVGSDLYDELDDIPTVSDYESAIGE